MQNKKDGEKDKKHERGESNRGNKKKSPNPPQPFFLQRVGGFGLAAIQRLTGIGTKTLVAYRAISSWVVRVVEEWH